jgi:hypothetical protein
MVFINEVGSELSADSVTLALLHDSRREHK